MNRRGGMHSSLPLNALNNAVRLQDSRGAGKSQLGMIAD